MTLRTQKSLLKVPSSANNEFVLLELPESLPLKALSEGKLVSTGNDDQVCLITGNESYAVNRVETSNALVLVPPPTETAESANLVDTPCRLLGKGSGAFFLELKPKQLDLTALQASLTTFDPYDEDAMFDGISVDQLVLKLQVSEKQIQQGLGEITTIIEFNGDYAVLSEEATQQVVHVVVDVFSECEELGDYASGKGLSRETIVSQAVHRIPESYTQLASAIRVGLKQLSKKEEGDDLVFIDFEKVAIAVAHKLFGKQAVWADDAFVKEWQAQVPGVGDAYQVYQELLRGVAIQNDSSQWTYLPCGKLPKDVGERFVRLFEVRDKWTKAALEPYFKDKLSQELLSKYTRTVSEEQATGEKTAFHVKLPEV